MLVSNLLLLSSSELYVILGFTAFFLDVLMADLILLELFSLDLIESGRLLVFDLALDAKYRSTLSQNWL